MLVVKVDVTKRIVCFRFHLVHGSPVFVAVLIFDGLTCQYRAFGVRRSGPHSFTLLAWLERQ